MRRFLAAVGRILLTSGALLLLFVGYQLWGTGVYQSQAQDDLARQFAAGATTSRPTSTLPATTTPGSTTTTTTTPLPPAPDPGSAVASIRIPTIGVDQFVVEGVGVDDLRKGPGHYPTTVLPGQAGTAAIAGHRTTYGAPFGNLDALQAGDQILVRTVQGSFRYRVLPGDTAGYTVVDPSRLDVLNDQKGADGKPRALLILTTCHPKYSAAQRLIVTAELVVDPGTTPLPPTRAEPEPGKQQTSLETDLSGEESSRTPTIVWGLIAALIGALWWLAFHRHPSWYTWIPGAVPFLIALFVCYQHLERLLPANY